MQSFNVSRLRRCCDKLFFHKKEIQNRFYSDESKNKYRNVLKLHERGMFQDIFPDTSANQVSNLVNENSQAVYAGFDPTADSLHIGNLLVLMNLLHWQRGGHRVIALLGGATGLIGDPSHRLNERIAMEQTVIDYNIKGIKNDIMNVFHNHEKYFWKNNNFQLKPLTIINNIDWYKNVNIIEFIRTVGKHFRMGTMLGRTSVQSRLKSDSGMSFTEFSYQLFQAYDWMHLLENYNCRFQIGGNDQMGNIMSGHELISRTSKKSVFGFTLPLITAEGGKKFGKSLGNAVWLAPEKSSSFDLYQFFVRTTDNDVENYLKLFTFLPLKQIAHIVKEHKEKPEERKAQKILAENVTLLVHGEQGLEAAKTTSMLLYDKSIESLSSMTQDQVTQAFEGSKVIDLVPDENMTVLDLAMKAECFKTMKDAIRVINAGGFHINYTRITDIDQIISGKHRLKNDVTLIRVGKKTYFVIKWLQTNKADKPKKYSNFY
ncbi:unnamed protein product [Trichogramma brassicae]|uniref:Tyrosine--tRNA ligase n=1 Tax=Trichogramma brassicae TaxID=86971 RepID=A0A6H5IR76_9HYME|nr:unnamed protein product [Trichogramma brassicae]